MIALVNFFTVSMVSGLGSLDLMSGCTMYKDHFAAARRLNGTEEGVINIAG